MIPQTKPCISVYEPAKVSIDGQEYTLRKRTRSVLGQLAQIEQRLGEAKTIEESVELGYQQFGLLVDMPQEAIDELDLDQVKVVTNWVRDYYAGRVKAAEDPEKNSPRPGDEPPAA